MVCYRHRTPELQFDAIDLDPYGTPAQFLDGAIQSVAEGGVSLVDSFAGTSRCLYI
jgi:tRNA (guanine26-N2/guanine27-N2)-dimethyltransferase